MDPRRAKRSCGILLCRYNHEKNCYEYLLEQRPYRYGFVQFLTHHYSKADQSEIIHLMSDMSPEDKVTLASLSFDACYSRIYRQIPALNSERYPRYLQHKTHFEKSFLSDGGRWLLDQLSRTGSNSLHWDIPRGRKASSSELDLECAIREFGEETGIPSTDYNIIDADPVYQKFQSLGHHYINCFFLAELRNPAWNEARNLRINYLKTQHSEVIDLRWVSLQEVQILDTYDRLYSFLRAVTNLIKKNYRRLRTHKKLLEEDRV